MLSIVCTVVYASSRTRCCCTVCTLAGPVSQSTCMISSSSGVRCSVFRRAIASALPPPKVLGAYTPDRHCLSTNFLGVKSEFDYDSGGRQNGKNPVELSENAAIGTVEIKAGIAHVMAVEDVEDFPGQRQFPLLEEKRLAQPHIDAVVKGHAHLISLVSEKIALRILTKESRDRLAAAITPLAAQIPRIVKSIVAVHIQCMALIGIAGENKTIARVG